MSALLFWSALPASALGKSSPPIAPAPQQPAPAAAASEPVRAAIAVQDIPLEADRLLTLLRALDERAMPKGTTRDIEARLPAMAQRIADAQFETKDQLAAASSMTVLTNLADLWFGIQGDLKASADRLRVRTADVGAVLDQLATLADTWTRTRDEARRTKAPPAVLKRTEEALTAMAKTQGLASARRAAVLTVQVKIGEQLALVEVASAQLAQAMSAAMSTLFRRDGLPVWRVWGEVPSPAELAARVRQSAAPQLDLLARVFTDRSGATAVHLGSLVVFVPFALVARRRVRRWEADDGPDPMLRVLELPVSAALIVTLQLSDFLYVRAPMVATNLIGLVLLAGIFTLNRPRDLALLSTPVVVEQYVALLIVTAATASLVWLWRRDALVVGPYRLPDPLAWLAMTALAVGVAVNAALKAAGIEMAFPRRDVTLRFPSPEET